MIKHKEKYDMFINEFKSKIDIKNKKIVFLCIGTNKVVGDSFGPIVGTKLESLLKYNENVAIFGNISMPINALNIKEKLIYINKIYEDRYVVVIDSAVSDKNCVGEIFVTKNEMVLGKGINKEIFKLGDVSIKCSVCKDEYDSLSNYKSLLNVSKKFIKTMSDIVSIGIYDVISNIK